MCGIDLRVFINGKAPRRERCHQSISSGEDADSSSAQRDGDGAGDGERIDGSANDNIRRRGPDSFQQVVLSSACRGNDDDDDGESTHTVVLGASVLSMRSSLTVQPIKIGGDSNSDEAAYLAWNGEVYQHLPTNSDAVMQDAYDFRQSDTQLVADLLQQQGAISGHHIAQAMSTLVNAEYSFAVITNRAIYFGRDAFGKRSLIRQDCAQSGCVHIASVAPSLPADESTAVWTEVPPGQVFEYDLQTREWTTIPIPTLIPPPILSHAQEQQAKTDAYPRIPTYLTDATSSPPSADISDELWQASLTFERLLRQAVWERLDHCKDRPTTVLFSGGIDSVVLARLAIEMTPDAKPVILSNVSFGDDFAKSADRKAALTSHAELRALFPNKSIVYQDLIVSWEETLQQEQHIRTLLYPKQTTMDLNIATALWFACRGDATPSRVLLLGMGADEQLGGYGRHRKAHERGELQAELQMDQDRLWQRNLGRDDRIAADHGKEARFPYLDSNVVHFLRQQPCTPIICDFTLPPGVGDKRLLRIVAQRLGLQHASGLVKRAIQFGSRIAHVSDTKRFGSRRKAKGEKRSPKMSGSS